MAAEATARAPEGHRVAGAVTTNGSDVVVADQHGAGVVRTLGGEHATIVDQVD
jgi:hypothetical protein